MGPVDNGTRRRLSSWFSGRRGRQRALLLATLLTVGLLWVFVGGNEGVWVQRQIAADIAGLKQGNMRLRAENERMRRQIARLQSDLLYIERIARERYGMARPGERVYRVLPYRPRSGQAESDD